MGIGNVMGGFAILGVICGIVGWGVIEMILWIFSHILVSWL